MTRRGAAAAAMLLGASTAMAQLVPITRCNSAIPCNIPMGLRPADAAGWTPGNKVGQGNTGISVTTGIENGFKPKIDRPPVPVSEDPVEAAARMYVRKNPAPPVAKPTAAPTPQPTPSSEKSPVP